MFVFVRAMKWKHSKYRDVAVGTDRKREKM